VWTWHQTHYYLENHLAAGMKPGPLDLLLGTLTSRPRFTENHVFWDITPCSLVKVNPTFGREASPSSSTLKRRVSQTNQHEGRNKHGSVPPKRGLTFNGLQGVISQKTTARNCCCENLKSSTCFGNKLIICWRHKSR
jgi:hypothetical protein